MVSRRDRVNVCVDITQNQSWHIQNTLLPAGAPMTPDDAPSLQHASRKASAHTCIVALQNSYFLHLCVKPCQLGHDLLFRVKGTGTRHDFRQRSGSRAVLQCVMHNLNARWSYKSNIFYVLWPRLGEFLMLKYDPDKHSLCVQKYCLMVLVISFIFYIDFFQFLITRKIINC